VQLKQVRSEEPDGGRRALYRRAIWTAIGGNLLLVVVKGIVAWVSGSSAVLSDAANSFSDTLYSSMMAVGLALSQRPADETHPQGHSRFEPLVSLFIAGAMTTAAGIALWQSIQRFTTGPREIQPGWPIAVSVGSILVKVVMYVRVRRIGEEAQSPAIWASARDNLADSLSSLAALIGVTGARWIHPFFDPLAGAVVAVWILYTAWQILRENLGYLTGQGPPEGLTQRIAAIALQVSGVIDVHQVIAEYVGPQLRVDMHIDVDGSLSLDRAHAIADRVEEIVGALPEVDLAFVHVEPIQVPEHLHEQGK
jgi:cation diffusion facilitator family transporter